MKNDKSVRFWTTLPGLLTAVGSLIGAVAVLLSALYGLGIVGPGDGKARVTASPATEPPITEPPITEPPITEPPTSEPPTSEPPTSEPPTSEPPSDSPSGFVHRSTYGGNCSQRPAGSVCVGFSDGYVWLVFDSIVRWDDGGSYQGRSVQTAVGSLREYHHVLGTDLVKEVLGSDFVHRSTYGGNCSQRPAGSVCVGFSDGYVWLVFDSIVRWDDGGSYQGRSVQTAVGNLREYHHVLGTDLVKEVPKQAE